MQLLQTEKIAIGAQFVDHPEEGRCLQILREDAERGIDEGVLVPLSVCGRLAALIHAEVQSKKQR